jgi:hypothetical protein
MVCCIRRRAAECDWVEAWGTWIQKGNKPKSESLSLHSSAAKFPSEASPDGNLRPKEHTVH